MPRTYKPRYQFPNEDRGLVEKWLERFSSKSSQSAYYYGLASFVQWYKKPLQTFLDLPKRGQADIALKFQNQTQDSLATNTVLGTVRALGSFTTYHKDGEGFKLGRLRLKTQYDMNSHTFHNSDLTKMFEAADLQQKAIVSTFASLGWEFSGVFGLDRKYVESIIKQAREEKADFAFIKAQRHKTGAPRFAALTPLAMVWLERWFKQWKGKTLFKIRTKMGLNESLKQLAQKAGITTTGSVHSHLFRGWVISQLTRAGWSEYLIKYYVGKAIPSADGTYLHGMEEMIVEKMPKAYECLNIVPEKEVKVIDRAHEREFEEMKVTIQNNEKQIAELNEKLETLIEISQHREMLDAEKESAEAFEKDAKDKTEIAKQLSKEGVFKKSEEEMKKLKKQK
jgi:hypothetical protein